MFSAPVHFFATALLPVYQITMQAVCSTSATAFKGVSLSRRAARTGTWLSCCVEAFLSALLSTSSCSEIVLYFRRCHSSSSSARWCVLKRCLRFDHKVQCLFVCVVPCLLSAPGLSSWSIPCLATLPCIEGSLIVCMSYKRGLWLAFARCDVLLLLLQPARHARLRPTSSRRSLLHPSLSQRSLLLTQLSRWYATLRRIL